MSAATASGDYPVHVGEGLLGSGFRALDGAAHLVTDEHAPSFWVLADPEGNMVCLCTQQER